MDPIIIAALITGGCAIVAAIIAGVFALSQTKKKKKEVDRENLIRAQKLKYTDVPIPPTPKHPVFLNPDDYDIDKEEFFVTLGGLLQQSRHPKDVSIRRIKKSDDGEEEK